MRDGYDSGVPTSEELQRIQATDQIIPLSSPTTDSAPGELTLEEKAEIERQVRFVTKLSVPGQEQTFVSPTIPDAVDGILEIVKELLTTGQAPDNRVRLKLYGTIGTKKVHLLSEVNVEVRPGRYADYL